MEEERDEREGKGMSGRERKREEGMRGRERRREGMRG